MGLMGLRIHCIRYFKALYHFLIVIQFEDKINRLWCISVFLFIQRDGICYMNEHTLKDCFPKMKDVRCKGVYINFYVYVLLSRAYTNYHVISVFFLYFFLDIDHLEKYNLLI